VRKHKLMHIVTTFLIFTFAQFLLSQEEYLINNMSGHHDIAVDISVSPKRNVYVTGYTNNGISKIMTIKYSTTGQELWRNYYEGAIGLGARATAIETNQFDNIYVIGSSFDTLTASNFATLKYNYSGQLEWTAIYNSIDSSDDQVSALCIDQFGSAHVTGASRRDSGTYNYLTIKYNSTGNLVWKTEYDGSGNYDDFAKSIAIDKEKNVFITGASYDSSNYYDYVTIKYDKFGVQKWLARYNGPFNGGDYARSLTLDDSGNVFVTGYSFNGFSNHHEFCTIKYDSQGVEKFVQRYNRGNNSSGKSKKIIVDHLSNTYVIGWNSLVGPSWDIITLKYNSDGVQLWSNVFNSGFKDDPADIGIDHSGNIYVTGYSWNSSAIADYTTIKYNRFGKQEWVVNYNGPANEWDSATAIALDSLGYIYVTGYSRGIDGIEYATIKYDSLGNIIWIQRSGNITNVENENNLKVSSFSLSQNYPNPFNPSTKIKYEIPELSFVTLKIYDVLGNEVATLVSEEKPAGNYQVNFDALAIPSGIYFYRLQAGNFIQTKKMVLLR